MALSLQSKDITKLRVNKEEVVINNDSNFVYLPSKSLLKGSNNVAVLYTNSYDNDGQGCVSFTDVDGEQYIYTQFESYYANRVLACFDQPDLKAKMKLNVISPKNWKKILSNEYATTESDYSEK